MLRKLIITTTFLLLSAALVIAQQTNGRVIEMWGFLNVRAEPSRSAPVIAELEGQTPVTIIGRTAGNNWLQILTPEGGEGWVAATFVELTGDITSLPVVEGLEVTVATTTTDTDSAASEPATGEPITTTAPAGTALGTGRVIAGILNLRGAPTEAGEIITQLPFDTLVSIFARTEDGRWIQVSANGVSGWVAARFVNANVSIGSLPVGSGEIAIVTTADGEAVPAVAAAPVQVSEIITIGSSTRSIYLKGQQMGNRRDVFSKVGDSITFNPIMFDQIGIGNYNLGDYPGLGATIQFFSATTARNSNSFANDSLAAFGGWTAENAMNPRFANQELCAPDEAPVACEYRYTRPAVAMIMFGTNDVQYYSVGEYAYYMRQIIDLSIERGVIPVISTLPPRNGFDQRINEYNNLLVSLASEYGIPLWDYHLAMIGLPNFGLDGDGTHPSVPPEGLNNGANFQFPFLNYGYVMRNLTALQMLEALRINVLGG